MSTKTVALAAIMSDANALGYDPDNPGLTLGAGHPGFYYGDGAPTFAAAKGSIYSRTDGSSSSTRLYVCSVAAGTWVAVTTAS